MLIAAITAFLVIHFGLLSSAVAGPFDQTAALIKKDVADDARQEHALAIVDQMKSETGAYAAKREKSLASLGKLTAKRATPTSEIERAAQPLIAEDRASAERLLDLRFQLKSVLTAGEWAKIFPAPATEAAGRKKPA